MPPTEEQLKVAISEAMFRMFSPIVQPNPASDPPTPSVAETRSERLQVLFAPRELSDLIDPVVHCRRASGEPGYTRSDLLREAVYFLADFYPCSKSLRENKDIITKLGQRLTQPR